MTGTEGRGEAQLHSFLILTLVGAGAQSQTPAALRPRERAPVSFVEGAG